MDYLDIDYQLSKGSEEMQISNVLCVDMFLDINVHNRETNERFALRSLLCKVPVLDNNGFIENNVHKLYVPDFESANGFHFDVVGEDNIVKLYPDSTKGLGYSYVLKMPSDGDGSVVVSKLNSDVEIPLGAYLKVVTKKTTAEIVSMFGKLGPAMQVYLGLGPTTDCDSMSLLNASELVLFLLKAKHNENNTLKVTTAYNCLVGDVYHSNRDRIISMVNFNQYTGLKLAEDIDTGLHVYSKNTVISPEIAKEINYSSLNSVDIFPEVGQIPMSVNRHLKPYFTGLTKKVGVDELEALTNSVDNDVATIVASDGVTRYRNVVTDKMSPEIILSVVDKYVNAHETSMSMVDDIDSIVNQSVTNLQTMINNHLNRMKMVIDRKIRAIAVKNPNFILSGLSSADLTVSRDEELYIIDIIKKDRKNSVQSVNETNAVSRVSDYFKISKTTENLSQRALAVQGTQAGKICPFDVPESSKVGRNHNRTVTSKVDENGNILAPYVSVATGEVVYITAQEEEGKYIGEFDTDLTKDTDVTARIDGNLRIVPISKLDYIEYSPYQDMSVSRMLSTFPENSAAKRQQMASSHAKQAVGLLLPERPLVGSGGECILPRMTGMVKTLGMVLQELKEKNLLRSEIAKNKKAVIKSTNLVNTNLSVVIEYDNETVDYSISTCKASDHKTITGYKLRPIADLTYSYDDVMFIPYSYDMRDYDKHLNVNLGGMKEEEGMWDSALALGTNLFVGYMTYSHSSIDDAIVISDALVDDDRLTNHYVYPFKVRLDANTNSEEQLVEDIPLSKGMPIKAGDVICHKKRVITNEDGTTNEVDTSVYAPFGLNGFVTSITRRNDEVTITIVSTQKVEIGDKLSGRHGNKGVIAKIVPRTEMYYDPVTGKSLDIILNPLGIPSRTNVSQVLEVALGGVLKQENKISVVTPFQKGQKDDIAAMEKAAGLEPRRLVNGKDGTLTDKEIQTGYIYMLKLEHRASEKLKSIGYTDEVDPTFKQPTGGSTKEKGQAISEMETWCLQSAGALNVLQELQTIGSDDRAGIDKAKEQIAEDPLGYSISIANTENRNLDDIKPFYISLGVKFDLVDGIAKYKPFTDTDTLALNKDSTSPHIEKPFHDKSVFRTQNTYSWINLNGEIPHPYWLEKVLYEVLYYKNPAGELVHLSVKMIKGLLERSAAYKTPFGKVSFVEPFSQYTHYFRRDDDNTLTLLSKDECRSGEYAEEDCISGFSVLLEMMKTWDADVAVHLLNDRQQFSTSSKQSKIRNTIDFVVENGGMESFIISKYPVLPLRFRHAGTIKNLEHDFDKHYTAIQNSVWTTGTSQNRHPDMYTYVYEAISTFVGLRLSGKGQQNLTIREFYTVKNKNGHIRQSKLKKRVYRSFRTVVIPSPDPTLTLGQIGIPYLIIGNTLREEIRALVKTKIGQKNAHLADRVIDAALTDNPDSIVEMVGNVFADPCNDVKTIMREYAETQVTIFGRQPSLHKFNIRCFDIRAVEGRAVQVHPLVCKGYNMDFDGDQAWGQIPLTNEAKKEARELLYVPNHIINPGTGDVIVDPSQDILLGLYYMTSLAGYEKELRPEFKTVTDCRTIDGLVQMLETGLIKPYELASVCVNGKTYVSTAGRLQLNNAIGDCFTSEPFTDPMNIFDGNLNEQSTLYAIKYDCTMGGRDSTSVKVSDLIKSIYLEDSSSERMVSLYQNIGNLGFYWSERSGTSFTLKDLEEPSVSKEFLEKADTVLAMIDRKFNMGLLSLEDRKSSIDMLYSWLRSDTFRGKFIDDIPLQNNLRVMYESKARGSLDQILQSIGLLGVLQKSKTQTLEQPILSNYASGLSPFDLFQTSYSTRLGLISTIYETSKPGELTRTLTYMFNSLVSTDNQKNLAQEYDELKVLKVPYIHKSDMLSFLPYEDNGFEDAMFRTLSSTLKNFKEEDIPTLEIEDEEIMKFITPYLDSSGKHICTTKRISFLNQMKCSQISYINTTTGRLYFDTEFPALFDNLLLLRYTNMDYPHLEDGCITEKTISHFKKTMPRYVSVHLLINDIGDDVNVKSIGKMIDSRQFPVAGNQYGIECAQAIGEPSAQLTMSLFHRGGQAGASIDSGVDILKRAIQNASYRLPYGDCAVVATNAGTVSRIGGSVYVGSVKYNNLTSSKCIHDDGVWVEEGMKLSEGIVLPFRSFTDANETNVSMSVSPDSSKYHAVLNPNWKTVVAIRLSIVDFLYSTYKENGIDIKSRHFECAAVTQTSHGVYVNGDMDRIHKMVFDNIGMDYVLYGIDHRTSINLNSGSLAGLAYQDPFNALKTTVDTKTLTPIKETGFIAQILSSSPVNQGPRVIVKHVDQNSTTQTINKLERFKSSGIVKPKAMQKQAPPIPQPRQAPPIPQPRQAPPIPKQAPPVPPTPPSMPPEQTAREAGSIEGLNVF